LPIAVLFGIMPEYRPVPDEREDDRARITSYGFDAGSGPYNPDATLDERLERRWSFGEAYALYDGDEAMLSTCVHMAFTARLRGEWLPVAGVSAVASPPEHRRQGYVGDLLAASLADYRERGWPLAALHPFDESFYARYGWATGERYWTAAVEPAALAPAAGEAGTFRRVRAEDGECLTPAYEAWLDGVDLATRRSADWWRDRLFHGVDDERYCYAWERDGEVRGYVIYDIADDRLKAREFASADHEAYRNLLRFLRDHSSQVEAIELSGPDHARLVDLVADRDAVEAEVTAGKMVRIVDVPAALEAVPYTVDGADITLDVSDGHADWNDDRFALRVRNGAATVEPTDADPDVSLDIGTLSQLLVGHRGVERARADGDMTVHDADAAGTLARSFPRRETFLPEQF